MTNEEVHLDTVRHAVTCRGQKKLLQEKTWQVLTMLAEKYPEVVLRDDIIERVWGGNSEVGEKGLNQAIWQLRRALDDNSRDPRIIRTIPRVGYQWMRPPNTCDAQPTRHARPVATAAVLAAIACIIAIVAGGLYSDRSASYDSRIVASKSPATDVYLVGRDVHVVFENGTVGILRNANRANIRSPVLSEDGSEIAVAVIKDGRCRMVTIDLLTREREDFEDCPAA